MIDYSSFKKILVLDCHAGGGHKMAAEALSSQMRRLNPSVEIIRQNAFDLIGDCFKRLIESVFWAKAQRLGYVSLQEKLVSCLPLFDKLFSRLVYKNFLSILSSNEIDHIIDTQPLFTSSILDAIVVYNSRFLKSLKIEKVLTEIPSEKCYFTQGIKGLTQKQKELFFLRVYAESNLDLLKETLLDEDRIIRSTPPIREGFLNPDIYKRAFLHLKASQAEKILFCKLGFPLLYRKSRLIFSVKKFDKIITVLLGFNSPEEDLKSYLKKLFNFFSKTQNQTIAIVCFCSSIILQEKLVELFNTYNQVSATYFYPVSSQDDKIIAPLFFQSDLTLTKSGGMTTMELASLRKGRIWIHVSHENEMPKWERDNAEFLVKNHQAKLVSLETFNGSLQEAF